MPVKVTTETFIKRSREVHGDRYDYSHVEYENYLTAVSIICKNHGSYEQKPNAHLYGAGCPKCWEDKNGKERRSNKEEFIEKARQMHGNKYGYLNVHYINCKTKVIISCPDHGEFKQSPAHHLAGSGCKKCFIEDMSKEAKENFETKSRKIHGEKYNYSKVEYGTARTMVTIICDEHGEFMQTPDAHLQGRGCPICRYVKSANATRKTKEEFIKEATLVHGKYDYSNIDYNGANKKITITCPDHGEFTQTPSSHLMGCGCPGCAIYGFNPDKQGLLYVIKANRKGEEFVKVGITNNIELRMDQLRKAKYEIIRKKIYEFNNGHDAKALEQLTHEAIKSNRIETEEKFDGYTECFNVPFEKAIETVNCIVC